MIPWHFRHLFMKLWPTQNIRYLSYLTVDSSRVRGHASLGDKAMSMSNIVRLSPFFDANKKKWSAL